jgi:mono/diheme cytochrome c family protein
MRRANARRPWFGDVTVPTPLYLPVSFVVLGLVAFLALVVLMIGARSPYTHANLAEGFDPRYYRTAQILVSADTVFAGLSRDVAPAGANPVTRGASLYVTQGCASCHALEGRGGPVGPRLVGVDDETVANRVRQGPVGMPRFSAAGLTDAEISDITAYLRSLGTN